MQYRLTAALLAAAMLAVAPGAHAQKSNRPERLLGHPNLNGIWQAMNTANWNLEAHSATDLKEFWQLGALAAIPAGQSVVKEGEIPYLPAALEQRNKNRAGWPASDPETSCYLPGIPRATYMPYPFQIFQGDGDILMVYAYATINRLINMGAPIEPPVDTWMGQSNGHWDGDTLVVETHGFNDRTWLDRSGNFAGPAAHVTERFTLVGPDHIQYQATIENPEVFSKAWTIEMPLYRHIEPNARLLEFKCVPFADKFLYHDLLTSQNQQQKSSDGQ
ncbi:MAG TPA: hypothetical protein VFV10_20480 [Gammaproteobacteria bacterium]|nr:hypothetical protein [Gammaproteobacteria bacterium]